MTSTADPLISSPGIATAGHLPSRLFGTAQSLSAELDTALTLSEQMGTEVHLSYRGDKLRRVNPANRRRMDEALSQDRLRAHWSLCVEGVSPEEAPNLTGS